jgi:hypothetical protein
VNFRRGASSDFSAGGYAECANLINELLHMMDAGNAEGWLLVPHLVL